MRTSLLLSAFALSTLVSAQFSSGFENWTDTVPSDWMGSKTTLNADSVEQVSTNVHGGTYAVRLINGPSSHKRFTTQPVTVTDGTIYDITFWVRGNGSIRTGLFDGRTSGSGYASYNPYVVVSSNTWTQVTQSIACANDTVAAEFILSVQLTSGPEHLVVDDVNITAGGAPVEASIYDIQYSTAPDGASPLANSIVITGGIVTGVDTIGADSYFIQSGTGPWSGIYVYDQGNTVAIGDSVLLQGTVTEFNGVTELSGLTSLSVVGQYPVPAPELLDTFGATQEQWEGVLAVIANAECTSLPDGFGEWGISQGSGPYIVDDLMFPYTPTVGTNYDVTGCIHYANGSWKIEPRFLADIVVATGIPSQDAFGAASIGPNPTSDLLRVNTGLPVGTRVNYAVSEASGRIVRTGILSGNGTIDLQGLATGVYHLSLRTNEAVKSFAVQVK